jgi:epoxide hydrolase 4
MCSRCQYVSGYAAWLGTAIIALPIWVGISISLGFTFLKNPFKFCRRVKRNVSATCTDLIPGLEHRMFEVNGVLLHAATTGLGSGRKLLLLLHGFPESWQSWRHQIAALKDTFEVVALDMRGFGSSDAPKGVRQYSMRELCADVVAVVKATGHTHCYLVGHDWGGAVAWAVAANHPNIVRALAILCSPHPAAYKDQHRFDAEQARRSWYFLLFMARRIPEIWLGCRDFERVERLLTRAPWGVRRREAVSFDDMERFKAALSRPGTLTAATNYYRASIADQTCWRCREVEKAVTEMLEMPVLVMVAEHDAAFCHHMFTGMELNVRNLTLIEIPDSSHWAQQDRPEIVTEQLRNFFMPEK